MTCEEVEEQRKTLAEMAKINQINNAVLPEDRALEEWAKKSGAKRCSKCRFWVQKSEGCDHMTCRCGYEFCYVCGGKYGEC